MTQREEYYVVEVDSAGKTLSVISGMGKNRGKWDYTHSRSAAYRHLKRCREDDPKKFYKVEST